MSPVLRTCPACRAEVSPEHRFCPECGHNTTGPGRADAGPALLHAPSSGAPSGPTPFVPSRVIDKVYRLVERIGVGGMGSVWRAEHVLLKRPCAVKLMAPEFTGGVRFREKFIQEGSVLAGLDHPGIVHCTHAGVSEEGQLYLVMELAAGLTLREILKSEGRLALGPALAIARGILDAAEYAHANRVVHRDLKPENVLVDGWGSNRLRVKVLDFGIAKVVEESADVGRPAGASRTYAGWGTLPYMSPEQAAGDPVDHQTDVYAVGAMTYEMLAGRTPIQAETQRKLLWKVANEVPEGLCKARPDVPAGVEAAVMAALAKEAGDRPASAAALRAALGEPSGRPSAAPGDTSGRFLPVRIAGAAADPTRQWRIAAILAGVLALGLVAALVWPKLRAPNPETAGGTSLLDEIINKVKAETAAGNRATDRQTSATRYRLTLVADPQAGGTVRCLTPGDDFEDGAEVTILASPTTPGYEFAGWANAPSEKPKRTWYMQPGGNELVARFRRVRHRVQATVFPKDAGTVEPDDTEVNHGDLLTLVARESNAAYRFAHWRGTPGTTARLELRVTEPTTVVAEFELARHALTILSEPTNGGTVTAYPPGPEHEHGAEVTLVGIPAAGWRFKGWQATYGPVFEWSGDIPATVWKIKGWRTPTAHVDAFLLVQVTEPTAYTALFEQEPPTMQAPSASIGKVTLRWAKNAETSPTVATYEVYRKMEARRTGPRSQPCPLRKQVGTTPISRPSANTSTRSSPWPTIRTQRRTSRRNPTK